MRPNLRKLCTIDQVMHQSVVVSGGDKRNVSIGALSPFTLRTSLLSLPRYYQNWNKGMFGLMKLE